MEAPHQAARAPGSPGRARRGPVSSPAVPSGPALSLLLEAAQDLFSSFLDSLPPPRLEEFRGRVYRVCARAQLRQLLLPPAPAASKAPRAGRRAPGAAAEAEHDPWAGAGDPALPSLLQVCGRLGMSPMALPVFRAALEARGVRAGGQAAPPFPAPPYLFLGQVFCDFARMIRSPAAGVARELRQEAGALLAAYLAPLAAARAQAGAGRADLERAGMDRARLERAALSDTLLDEALGPLADRFWPRGAGGAGGAGASEGAPSAGGAGFPLPAPLPGQLSLLSDCLFRVSPEVLAGALGELGVLGGAGRAKGGGGAEGASGTGGEASPAPTDLPALPAASAVSAASAASAASAFPTSLSAIPSPAQRDAHAAQAGGILDLDLSALPLSAFWRLYRSLLRAVRPETYHEVSAALRRG